jgi:hypothetical protein
MGFRQWSPHDTEVRLDEWLKVRHAIAHGHSVLPQVQALQVVRGRTPPPADPTIRLVDAEQCLAFLRRLGRLTVDGLASHLAVPAPT